MIVTEVRLTDFLSYTAEAVRFSGGLNVVTGANASGKTNLIDSIYYAAIGRSSRHSKDKDLIRWGAETGAMVTVKVQKRFSTHAVDIYVDPQGKKRVLVDGIPISRIGELMGVVSVVFFSPEEIKLVKESPADRRRFLDISLSQQSKTYFYTLSKYNKLLQQRNKILKSYKGRPNLKDMLKIVDGEMIRAGAYLIAERAKFLESLDPLAAEEHLKLTGGKEALKLTYETETVDFGDIKGSLAKLTEQAFHNDERLEYTTIGPHRDDIKISASGVDLRRFGSQGQQRSAVLSLKLAEIRAFYNRTGETPVLLLDDVLSELDADRQSALFDAVGGMQTFVTCTEFHDRFSDRFALYEIVDRKVLKRI